MKILIFFSGIFMSLNCFAIYNGDPVPTGDPIAKTTVALSMVNVKGKVEYCTGIVVRQNVIMTAAHCSEGFDIVARVGQHIQSKGTTEPSAPSIQVQQLIVNDAYKSTRDKQEKHRQDIMLVKLKNPLPAEYVPAELGLENSDVPQNIVVAGFGAQSSSGKRQNMLDPGTAPENVELRSKTVGLTAYDKDVFKVDQTNGGMCGGDSGGPGFDKKSVDEQKPRVVSLNITAGDDRGADCGTVAFALRLSSKKDWIKEQLTKIDTSADNFASAAPASGRAE